MLMRNDAVIIIMQMRGYDRGRNAMRGYGQGKDKEGTMMWTGKLWEVIYKWKCCRCLDKGRGYDILEMPLGMNDLNKEGSAFSNFY